LSDTWIYYDADTLSYGRYGSRSALKAAKGGVYKALFNSVMFRDNAAITAVADPIVEKIDANENIPIIANGTLTVTGKIRNYVVYKEIEVTATREITVPVDLSIIKFPRTIEMIVTSKAVVQNGDEFIRNMDIAVDFVGWVREKFSSGDPNDPSAVDKVFNAIDTVDRKISGIFGV
jgi:hypothetical protein